MSKLVKHRAANKKKFLVSGDLSSLERLKEMWNKRLNAEAGHLSFELSKTVELREKIKTLMVERENFNKTYNDLLNKLKDGKTIMEDLARSVNHSLLMRQNISQKIEQILIQEKKQIQIQDEEAYDLHMRLEGELRYRNFNTTRLKERTTHVQKKPKLRKSTTSDHEAFQDLLWFKTMIFETCQEGSTITIEDVEDVLKYISELERQIYSFFNFVTHQNQELEVLKEQVVNQEKKFKEQELDEEMRRFLQIEENQSLQTEKEHIEVTKLTAEDETRGELRLLTKLFSGIENLLKLTKADVSSLLLLLGDNDNITEMNFHLFLQAIESKLLQLLRLLDTPQHIPPLHIQPSFRDNKLNQSLKSMKSQTQIVNKAIVSKPCPECFPVIKSESKTQNDFFESTHHPALKRHSINPVSFK